MNNQTGLRHQPLQQKYCTLSKKILSSSVNAVRVSFSSSRSEICRAENSSAAADFPSWYPIECGMTEPHRSGNLPCPPFCRKLPRWWRGNNHEIRICRGYCCRVRNHNRNGRHIKHSNPVQNYNEHQVAKPACDPRRVKFDHSHQHAVERRNYRYVQSTAAAQFRMERFAASFPTPSLCGRLASRCWQKPALPSDSLCRVQCGWRRNDDNRLPFRRPAGSRKLDIAGWAYPDADQGPGLDCGDPHTYRARTFSGNNEIRTTHHCVALNRENFLE
jgi:hypothetical protein